MTTYIASFDIGKKNFAFYVEEINTSELKLLQTIPRNSRYKTDGTPTCEFEKLISTIYLIGNKILYNINGNIRNYNMTADSVIQIYEDVSGNLSFALNMNSHINLNAAYRKQQGSGIDLSLLTARAEYTTNYRKLFFTIGLDFYRRTYIGDKLVFNGGSIQIVRRF